MHWICGVQCARWTVRPLACIHAEEVVVRRAAIQLHVSGQMVPPCAIQANIENFGPNLSGQKKKRPLGGSAVLSLALGCEPSQAEPKQAGPKSGPVAAFGLA
jgi:hypothetical protein